MFYKAPRFECHKNIFDATKVTYDTYSCAISGMSRKMMKIDGRDSAECQNWDKRDIKVIFELFKLDNRTKECYSVVSSINQREKRELGEKRRSRTEMEFFLVRESLHSL